MRRLPTVGLFCWMTVPLLAGLTPERLASQLTPADSADVILETARLFDAEGRWDVAEPLYRLLLERYAATTAATSARARLVSPPEAVVRGDGSTELTAWMTLYGVWLGVAVPGMFGADSAEPYGVGLLAGGPTGFVAGRRLARALTLTEGQARAMTFGGSWGTWQGWGWREVFDWGVAQSCQRDSSGEEFCFDAEESTEEELAAMVVGGLTGLAAGAVLSGRDITPGTATAVNAGALWGTWFGLAGGALADLEGDDLLVATLLGGDLALLATALMAPEWNVSRGRARLVSLAGLVGGLGGAGLDLLIQPDNDKVAIAIPLAGSVAGLILAISATGETAPAALAPGADGALLRLDEGRLSLGIPTPFPVLVRAGRRGSSRGPGIGVPLFRARL